MPLLPRIPKSATPTMRRVMGVVYCAGIVLWIVVGIKHILPLWAVVLAVIFCCLRIWMVLRPTPSQRSQP